VRLGAAVESLYQVFGRYPLPARIDYCDHCVTPDQAAALHRVPLRELSGDQLGTYAWKSFSTWGDLPDFKHFLPRLLELLTAGQLDDPWIVLHKIGLRWQEWPADERAAVEAHLRAWWRGTLTRFPAPFDAATMLMAIGATELDIDPFLADWETASTESAARHLAEYVRQGDPAPGATFERWLAGPAPTRMLEAAVATASTPAIATDLAVAHEFAMVMRAR
jgi:hypothetical protein